MYDNETTFELKNELRFCKVPHCPKIVARGLYWFFETHGLPLCIQFDKLLQHGVYPDWAYLCVEIARNGWNDERIYQYIVSEMEGCYHPDTSKIIKNGLMKLLKIKEKS